MKKQLSTAEAKKKAIFKFNAWIRKRDEGKNCISCDKPKPLQAGHFYPAGSNNRLRFHEDNVHGECMDCNFFDKNHLEKYKVNLINRIRQERFDALVELSEDKSYFPDDRFYFMEVIERYK